MDKVLKTWACVLEMRDDGSYITPVHHVEVKKGQWIYTRHFMSDGKLNVLCKLMEEYGTKQSPLP